MVHFTSTNEHSVDTQTKAKGGEHAEPNSDEDDAIFMPFQYEGDGRRREAKLHKMKAMVAKDEIVIERMIHEYQDSNHRVRTLENELELLRSLKISKKELQSKRNKLTAQLSRDRQKLEMSFLKAMCINYLRLMRRLDTRLAD